jgi:hypothetical protein
MNHLNNVWHLITTHLSWIKQDVQPFDYERTWWGQLRKRVVLTELDIYVLITILTFCRDEMLIFTGESLIQDKWVVIKCQTLFRWSMSAYINTIHSSYTIYIYLQSNISNSEIKVTYLVSCVKEKQKIRHCRNS